LNIGLRIPGVRVRMNVKHAELLKEDN
jgi:hypothetical protein